jgi:hypothetical protein
MPPSLKINTGTPGVSGFFFQPADESPLTDSLAQISRVEDRFDEHHGVADHAQASQASSWRRNVFSSCRHRARLILRTKSVLIWNTASYLFQSDRPGNFPPSLNCLIQR